MGKEIIILDKEELDDVIKINVKIALNEHENEKKSKRIYYKNQVYKMLGMSFKTIKTLCEKGIIKTTASGMITEDSLNQYLHNKK